MDRKRQKSGKTVVWDAGGWTAEDGGGRTQTQDGGGVLPGESLREEIGRWVLSAIIGAGSSISGILFIFAS